MSDTTPIPEETRRFPSLAALRAEHGELLALHRAEGLTPPLLERVRSLIKDGRLTGNLLDGEDDRWAAQSWLDYWSSMLYRAGLETPEASLAEFDIDLAPIIPDELSPYMGLYPFREENRQQFFGRQRLVQTLVEHLQDNRLLAVVGPSGSGKSSLVLAGLLPQLQENALPDSGRWRYYSPFVPGSEPLANLARALRPPDQTPLGWVETQSARLADDPRYLAELVNRENDRPAVLVIDQFEELFTLCPDKAIRQAFTDALIVLIEDRKQRHTVILTMRTDFESLIVQLPTFQPLFEQAVVRVTPMTAAELREAVIEPANRVGLKFEDGVVDALVHDILGEPAALPLLQFTLLKLWEGRERNRVTADSYRQLGGGRLALARSADQFYDNLIREEQETARRILLRMVRPGEGLEVTNNRVRRDSLYMAGEARDRVDRVLQKLIDARLVRQTTGDTPADTQVEIAHEALVRNWPRLIEWLEAERDTIRRHLRLTAAAEQWQALGRDPAALLRGALLAEAQRYEGLNDLEREFVQASHTAEKAEMQEQEAARERELAAAKALAETERRRANEKAQALTRIRGLLAFLSILFLIASVAAAFAIWQSVVARNAQENAVAAQGTAVMGATAIANSVVQQQAVLDAYSTKEALAAADVIGRPVPSSESTIVWLNATINAARDEIPTTTPTKTPPGNTPTFTAEPLPDAEMEATLTAIALTEQASGESPGLSNCQFQEPLTRLGLLASTDPFISEGAYEALKVARPDIVSIFSYQNSADISRLLIAHPDATWHLRVYMDFSGRFITADQFVQFTIEDTKRIVNILQGRDMVIELHNEPNLSTAGMGTTWADGKEFAEWWLAVLGAYRQAFPGKCFLYPGLSPGAAVTGIRQDSTEFLSESAAAVQAADGIGLHIYWTSDSSSDAALDPVNRYIQLYPTFPIWITEASNVQGEANSRNLGAEYVDFWEELQDFPTVQAVIYFVADSTNPSYTGEIWAGGDIPEIVGERGERLQQD